MAKATIRLRRTTTTTWTSEHALDVNDAVADRLRQAQGGRLPDDLEMWAKYTVGPTVPPTNPESTTTAGDAEVVGFEVE